MSSYTIIMIPRIFVQNFKMQLNTLARALRTDNPKRRPSLERAGGKQKKKTVKFATRDILYCPLRVSEELI